MTELSSIFEDIQEETSGEELYHRTLNYYLTERAKLPHTHESVRAVIKLIVEPGLEMQRLAAVAKISSLAEDSVLTVVPRASASGENECFTCSLGTWDITLALQACEATRPLFGPHKIPILSGHYEYIRTHYDLDPRLQGKMTQEQLARPVLFRVDKNGLLLLDGANRLVNAYESKLRFINAFVMPEMAADAFRIYVFSAGQEVNYRSFVLDTWGTYSDRPETIH